MGIPRVHILGRGSYVLSGIMRACTAAPGFPPLGTSPREGRPGPVGAMPPTPRVVVLGMATGGKPPGPPVARPGPVARRRVASWSFFGGAGGPACGPRSRSGSGPPRPAAPFFSPGGPLRCSGLPVSAGPRERGFSPGGVSRVLAFGRPSGLVCRPSASPAGRARLRWAAPKGPPFKSGPVRSAAL